MLIAIYKNGNYLVELYSDGTKVKKTDQNEFLAEFPDSFDVKITDYCDLNCPMCHENSTTNGKHGNLNQEFFNTLKRGTEMAIGGGNPLFHPNLISFLLDMKSRGIICNLTVNERHFLQNINLLQDLINQKLVWGLGVSLSVLDDKTLDFASKNKNVVFHVIAGIFTDFNKLFDRDYKILILGYKQFGRGESFYSLKVKNRLEDLKQNLANYFSRFAVLSFDNLALKQLNVKSLVGDETWEKSFMGNDGESTMYVDLVKEQFATSSTSKTRFNLLPSINEMFKIIKQNKL